MYKHSAESIRETDNKMFVSLEEKTKFNNYENTLRKKDDSYNKEEVDNKIKELSDSTYGNVEFSYISESNTLDGYVKDLEICGNTIQDTDNLADIKSVGMLQEDGTYKMSIVSHGKNLIDNDNNRFLGTVNNTTGADIDGSSTRIGFLKVKPGVNYVLSREGQPRTTNLYFFDKNKKFIGKDPTTKNSFTIPDGCEYIKLYFGYSLEHTIQLEEGTVVTPYEPYQESRADITLPCQLEKIGDVSDKLYYDEKEKVWCIEKNIGEILLDGTENWAKNVTGTDNTINVTLIIDFTSTPNAISDKFKYQQIWNTGKEHFYLESKGVIVIEVEKSRLETLDASGFKKWLSMNNMLLKYVAKTPQKIILPLDTQIQLNSYANKTHIYTVSGEIEPTIKATLPKSLCASVQSLNDKTDIMLNRLENVETLKEGQNLSYESDNGYVMSENTNNGYIDNVKIEGKTLVNLAKPLTSENYYTNNGGTISNNKYTSNTNDTYNGFIQNDISMYKPNTTYTAAVYISSNTSSAGLLSLKYLGPYTSIVSETVNIAKAGEVGWKVIKFTTVSEMTSTIKGFNIISNAAFTGQFSLEKLIILEGDHTQNPPSYFEGLMSVGGNVNNIDVKSTNSNLFDINNGFTISNDTFVSYTVIDNNLTINIKNSTHNGFVNYKLPDKDLIEGETYTFYATTVNDTSSEIVFLQVVDGNGKHYTVDKNTPITFKKIGTMIIRFYGNIGAGVTRSRTFTDIGIYKGDMREYILHKSHKKSLLYYNDLGELTPVPELHEWDSIEKHSDGKWYYHKRSEKIVLNGSENWISTLNTGTTDEYRQEININISGYSNGNNEVSSIICDRLRAISFNNISYSKIKNGITFYTSSPGKTTTLVINNGFKSADEIKEWLQSNNVTVVYELAEEQVYECVNLNLDTYDNETMVICNSGAISPKISFSITSHIGNTVSVLRNRLKSIEEKYIDYKLNKDRLLLNARYKSDKGSFNVSIITLSSNIEEIDYELFELTKSVIESSLDKFNTDDMEELIDFYTIIGKFNYDMADILFGMIDSQTNTDI